MVWPSVLGAQAPFPTCLCVTLTPSQKDKVLNGEEEEARQYRRGLWAEPNPVPPWDFRHARRHAHK